MDIISEILNFDPISGSIVVRYKTDKVPEGLTYNIDLPVEDGSLPTMDKVDAIVKQFEPRGQLERIVAMKAVTVPDGLRRLPQATPAGATPTEVLVRIQRDQTLAASDWTQLADAPLSPELKGAWAAYRQELRNVPEQPGFPDNIVWPLSPDQEAFEPGGV